MMSLQEIKAALGGVITGRQVVCPGPGHSRRDRSLAVRPSEDSPLGFVAHSYAGDTWPEIRDHVCDRLGIDVDTLEVERPDPIERMQRRAAAAAAERVDQERRTRRALAIWNDAVDPRDTAVEAYLASRCLVLPAGIAGDVIRFHPACPCREDTGEIVRVPAMIALMRNVVTDAPVAIHRTRLSEDGRKLGRKMLGPTAGAAIKLDAAGDTLVVGEGIETGMSARQLGLSPVWALGSVGEIDRLPILPGINELTLLEERDESGASLRAVATCGARWQAAGRAVHVIRPRVGSDLNDQLRSMTP